jgi:uncharacterized membrane protein
MTDLEKSTMGTTQKSTSEVQSKVIYILYLIGIVVPLTSLVGVVMAYINRNNAPHWLKTHYTFQIRTFWIGLLYSVISYITTVVIVGFILLLGLFIWLIVRCVKGMQYLERQEAVPNPETWLIN